MDECKSFTHYEERCIYFLERIAFLPMFGRHNWVDQWLEEMEDHLRSYQKADIAYCGKKRLDFIRNVAFVVSSFMRLKLQSDASHTYRAYIELVDQLTMEPAEESGVTNPLAQTIYYDYLGLLHMLLFDLNKNRQNLEEAIRCFSLILDNYVEHTDMSLSIWGGFVGYNLARCYMKQHHLTRDPADIKKAHKLIRNASLIRKGWLSGTGFHATIRSAMSYEYFVCKTEQIGMMKMLEGYSDEDIRSEYKRLEGELESYLIQDEPLERLRFVQDLLKTRLEKLGEEDVLDESAL